MQKKGFTLIEILIVIVIIGLLAFTLIPRILAAQQRARDTGRIADVRQIGMGLQSYIYTNNTIPNSAGTGYKDISSISGVLLEHLKSIPYDKGRGLMVNSDGYCISSGNNYAYYTDGNKAAVTASMEGGKGNTAFCKGQVSTKMMFPKHSDGYNIDMGDYTKAGINIITQSDTASVNQPAFYMIMTGYADPLGGNNASLIERKGGTNGVTSKTAISEFTVSESRPLTFSYFTKKGTGEVVHSLGIRNNSTSTNLAFCSLNWVTSSVNRSFCTIQDYGDAWYRVSVTTTTGINKGNNISVYYGDTGGPRPDDGSRYIFGLQINEGSTALPYQATQESNHFGEMY